MNWRLRRTAIASKMEDLVIQQRAIMDIYDPKRKIGLIVDEWGTWHPPTQGYPLLWQQNTLRDALVAALTLDIFNRHADKVVMANIAQTVNVLQSMILTEGEKMLTTPTYHVYEMYSPHQNAQALRTSFSADPISFKVEGEESLLTPQELFLISHEIERKLEYDFHPLTDPLFVEFSFNSQGKISAHDIIY